MTLPKHELIDGKVIKHEQIGSNDVYLLDIDIFIDAEQFSAGQFVQLQVPDGEILLRRPISIADVNGTRIILIYRAIGKGTKRLTRVQCGDTVNILAPLGHGFNLDCQKPLLVGGGLGIAPLILLAKRFEGKADILMGCKNAAEMDWPVKMYDNITAENIITTDDGSMGLKGFTAQHLPDVLAKKAYDKIFVCGPEIMMKSVAKIAKQHNIICEVSLEKRMACGLGACLSCTIETTKGRQKVCKDGPVFASQEVFFDE